ncbi:MAG: hypothetical protein ACR2N4_00900, partial [Jatrophihabitans sp.]
GVGVRHCLGVGGRCPPVTVGGRSASQALRALAADDGTELVVVVSKPPDNAVAERLRAEASTLDQPVVWALLGAGRPDLTSAVEQVLSALGRPVPQWPTWVPGTPAAPDAALPAGAPGALRGLFCGGTLCEEAMLIASAALGKIRSTLALRQDWALEESLRSDGHTMIDFGDDALTRGRAHPMIDPSLRNAQLRAAAADPGTAVLLLDVLLGHGAHPDPVSELVPLIAGSGAPVVLSLIGARQDPQQRDRPAERLHEAGASVFLSNAAATRHAISLVQQGETL